jgi:hypothetical protein
MGGEEPVPSPGDLGEGAQATTATPEPFAPTLSGSPEAPLLGEEGMETPVPVTPAFPPATGPGLATPMPEETLVPPEGPFFYYGPLPTAEAPLPTVTAETPAATATPLPMGAEIAPREAEGQPAAETGALAAEEGGPSRETVVRWLEVGLAIGLTLLFVSWILARRRGWA